MKSRRSFLGLIGLGAAAVPAAAMASQSKPIEPIASVRVTDMPRTSGTTSLNGCHTHTITPNDGTHTHTHTITYYPSPNNFVWSYDGRNWTGQLVPARQG